MIDEQGRPRRPEVVSFEDAVLEFSALEALRKWRFEPARLQGQAVKAYYDLTVDYRKDVCSDPAARVRKEQERASRLATPDAPP